MQELTSRIDRSRWTRAHTLIFSSTSLGMLIWGLEAAIGPAGYLAFHRSLVFLIGFYAFDFIGDIVVARLSDSVLARKGAFYLTMSMIGAGLLVLGLDLIITGGSGPAAVAVGLAAAAVMKVGIEGEVPVSLSFLAENSPVRYRTKVLVLSPNFNNIGSALGFAVLYLTSILYPPSSPAQYVMPALALLVVTAVALLATFLVRVSMPESVRWLLEKGMADRAAREASALVSEPASEVREVTPTVGLGERFAFLAILGVSQYLTFGLMAFTIAYFYFTGPQIYLISFIATLGASVAGVPAAYLADAIDSRTFALIAYAGGLASMIPIELAFALLGPSGFAAAFYPLLFINMVFSEFAWAVRTIYEPVLFPTNVRATMVGLVRVAPMISYDVSLYATAAWFNSYVGEAEFIAMNAALWALGALATLGWRLAGYDVRGALLESVSSPKPGRGPSPRQAAH